MSRTANTQAEFAAEVANCIGRKSASLSADGSTTYLSRIYQWLYWGHLRVARNFAFKELDAGPVDFTLTEDTGNYTFATLGISNVRQIMSIKIINDTRSEKLTYLHPRNFRKRFPNPAADTKQQPVYYTTWGSLVEVYPYPDDDYVVQLHWNKYPEDFTAVSSPSAYENKDDLITAAAVMEAYIGLQQYEDAKNWMSQSYIPKFQDILRLEFQPADWEPEGRATDMNGNGSIEWWSNPLVFGNP